MPGVGDSEGGQRGHGLLYELGQAPRESFKFLTYRQEIRLELKKGKARDPLLSPGQWVAALVVDRTRKERVPRIRGPMTHARDTSFGTSCSRNGTTSECGFRVFDVEGQRSCPGSQSCLRTLP